MFACVNVGCFKVNTSAWSDEHCSSWYTLSLIRLYLDNIGSKCNWAASCVFLKELALLWCGRQLLEIISSFFLCSRSLGFLFAVPNFTDGLQMLSLITYLSYVALKWCMTSPSYINRLFVSSPLFSGLDFI